MSPQQVAAEFIAQFEGDSSKALEEFQKQSQLRLSAGEVPNEKFTQVSGLLEQVSMIQDEIDRLGEATKIHESPAFNTLIANRVSGINQLLGEEIYETPDPMSLSNDVFDFEQALIHVESELPRIKDAKKRLDTMWVINELIASIDSLKGMNNVQA